ncbi:hypothetical protein GOV03_00675 [Candidatus Woesearchaeota archaeon]|nr:hypothetical protein [Candidatus Woesearchaeota archaeon]
MGGRNNSLRETVRTKIRTRMASGSSKKRPSRNLNDLAKPLVGSHRVSDPVTLPELLTRIESEVNYNTPLLKRLQSLNGIRSELERSYSVHKTLTNITEYTEVCEIASKSIELCVLTPSVELSQPKSKNWFYGDTTNEDLINIFAEYVEAGIREAFRITTTLRREIRQQRKIKRPLETLVRRDFKRVSTADLIQDIKAKRVQDMVPDKVYLVPYSAQYGGYAYFDDVSHIVLNVFSILKDKVYASNPADPNAVTVAHEVTHSNVQHVARKFHVEHLTRLVDFTAKNKRTFFFEFMDHPYTYDTEILDVVGMYLDSSIVPLYNVIRGVGWTQELQEIFWDKPLLNKAKLIEEKLHQIRKPMTEVMKVAEAEYYSLERYGLDALIVLTGLETLPMWLTAVQQFKEPIIGTAKERREFKRDYGKVITDLSDVIQEEFFEAAKENICGRDIWNTEYTIKDTFDEALNDNFDLTPNQKLLAWDMFLRDMVEDGIYEHVTPGDVLAVIDNSASETIEQMQQLNLVQDKAQVLVDKLQLYDYLKLRLSLAQDLADLREEVLIDEGELTAANDIVQFKSEALLPETNLLDLYGVVVYEDEDSTYGYNGVLMDKLSSMRKTHSRMTVPFFKGEGEDKHFKITKYFDGDRCVFVDVRRGHKGKSRINYEKNPAAILFSSDNSDRLNVMAYSSINDREIPGYGMFDSMVRIDEGFMSVSLDELLDPEIKTWYKVGKEVHEALDEYRDKSAKWQ